MKKAPGPSELGADLAEVREQLREALDTLEAIRQGAIDSLVIGPPGQEQIYTLTSADRSYRLIVEAMNEGAATVSEKGLIVGANPHLAAMLGTPRSHLVGRRLTEMVAADDTESLRRLLDLSAGEDSRGEVSLRRADGSMMPVALSVSAFDMDGDLLRCVVLTDLTERREAERRLRGAVAYNRSLIDSSLDPMMTVNPSGALADVNDAMVVATGLSRDALIGSRFSAHFADPGAADRFCALVLDKGRLRDYPLVICHESGGAIEVSCNGSLHEDAAGVASVFVAARDVTLRKKAEEVGRRLAAIVQSSEDAIIAEDLERRITTWSPGAEHLFGYTATEMIGEPSMTLVPEEQRDRDTAVLETVAAGRTVTDVETVRVTKAGARVPVSLSAAPLRDEDGRVIAVSSIVRDMSERKRAEDEIRALNAQLELRVQQRTAELARTVDNLEAFTYSVAHDLRSPLRALSGFSEALLEDYAEALDETGRDYTRRIAASGQRMAALIDDLLTLSRISRGPVEWGTCDLSAAVAEIAADLQRQGRDRDVMFAIEPGVRVKADLGLMRTVLQNLLDNAWKFTSRRAHSLIEFGTVPSDNGAVHCYVRDNGVGFDVEYRDKVFQPFHRLHHPSEYPGTGVGLASAARIVELHGGRIWADSEVDRGTTITFALPRANGSQ